MILVNEKLVEVAKDLPVSELGDEANQFSGALASQLVAGELEVRLGQGRLALHQRQVVLFLLFRREVIIILRVRASFMAAWRVATILRLEVVVNTVVYLRLIKHLLDVGNEAERKLLLINMQVRLNLVHVDGRRLADVAEVLVLMVQVRAWELELVRLDDVDLGLSLLHARIERQLLRRLAVDGEVGRLDGRGIHRERVEERSNPSRHLAALDVQVHLVAEIQRRKERMCASVL